MRVGWLILNLNVRGSVRRVVELSNRLVARGHDVAIYTTDGETCKWLPLVAPVRKLDEMEGHHDTLLKLGGPELTPYLDGADADRKIAYLLGLDQEKVDTLAEMVRGKRRARDQRTAETVQAIREGRTIANCTAIARWVEDVSGLPCPTVVAGVDFDVFKPGLVAKEPFLVLGGGGKQTVDGTQEILDMIGPMIDAEPRARMELYYYRGYSQEELATKYCSADVFVDAHRSGGWNNPVAEAMACGTAVVCTDIWGNEDFAINGKTALVVPPRDVEALAAAVLLVLRDGALRAHLVKNAQREIARFTWDRAADALEKAIG